MRCCVLILFLVTALASLWGFMLDEIYACIWHGLGGKKLYSTFALVGILPGSWVYFVSPNYCFIDPCTNTTKAIVFFLFCYTRVVIIWEVAILNFVIFSAGDVGRLTDLVSYWPEWDQENLNEEVTDSGCKWGANMAKP